ncbi:MAG: hypothetical protein R3F59_38770 [Myxococcota bacterium]
MARQSLKPWVGAALCAIAVPSCDKPLPYEGSFILPIDAAVLQPEVGGPFEEPVGFVANGHGGEILPLALKQGRFLTDDATVSFLPANPLPTGGMRRLTAVAVVAPGVREVTLWAADAAFGTLLRVPYLFDCEATPDRPECADAHAGEPVEQAAYWQPVEVPDGVHLRSVQVKRGYTTTETWTLTSDGASWGVEGSRSGRQTERAVPGEWSTTELHRLSFVVNETGTAGQQVVIRTESGLSEHDVGGIPLDIATSPDQSLLALIVQDRALDRPFVRWFDPAARELVGEVALPDDARPGRLSWTPDGALLVSDAQHPAVWELAVGATDALEHPTPWPTLDATALDGTDRRRLYVVPLDSGSVWLMDRDTDELLDVNPSVEGVQGMTFTASVRGVEAIPRPYLMPEYTDDGIRRIGRSVAVVLSSTRVVYVHEETGCLVQDNLGPRTEATQATYASGGDYATSWANTVTGGPVLELDGASARHVVVNDCAGIAQSESWRVTYDQNVGAWRVHGALSGDQVGLAHEDERYLSDGGEVSFVIRSGATPSRDGWTITFNVNAGSAQATGDLTDPPDGIPEIALGVSADPVYFEYRVGLPGPIGDAEGEGWYREDIRPLLLVAGSTSNQVGRVDPQNEPTGAGIELEWQ